MLSVVRGRSGPTATDRAGSAFTPPPAPETARAGSRAMRAGNQIESSGWNTTSMKRRHPHHEHPHPIRQRERHRRDHSAHV